MTIGNFDDEPTHPLGVPADPSWLTVARGELGVREVAGKADNPRIEEYLRTVTRLHDPADETPWCSAFVNWCVEHSGLVGTGRANARSWLRWGLPIATPRIGCVVVLWRQARASTKGHVAFLVGRGPGPVLQLLGGNQANAVSVRAYPRSRVLGYRWPNDAEAIA
jgi:uncharacterized protein (TIGR02594 family)